MRAVTALGTLALACGLALAACGNGGSDGSSADAGPGAGEPGCVDGDGDGHGRPSCGGDDCDDSAADTFPGAEDSVGDGVDSSCDGLDGIDADQDGHLALASGGDDCDDANPSVNPGQPEEEWQLEPIAEDGDTGHFTHVVVAPDGLVHVTFADLTSQQIVHGVRVDGTWQLETAVQGSSAAHDLAIGPDGTLYLCYALIGAEWSSSALSCGSLSEGGWTFEAVDESGWTGVDPSMRLTPDGALHVLYATVDGPSVTLRHATNETGAWVTEEVDGQGGHESAAAVDADGALQVAFVGVDGSLRWATKTGGAWTVEQIDVGPGLQGPSVVIATDGTVHVAYDRGGSEVLWATRSASAWRLESVAVSPNGASPAVVAGVLDPLGSAHLFFPRNDADAWGLGYATNLGGEWQTEIVDLDSAGQYSAAAVHGGVMYVAYLGGLGGDGDALFAFRGAPDGIDSNCDGTEW